MAPLGAKWSSSLGTGVVGSNSSTGLFSPAFSRATRRYRSVPFSKVKPAVTDRKAFGFTALLMTGQTLRPGPSFTIGSIFSRKAGRASKADNPGWFPNPLPASWNAATPAREGLLSLPLARRMTSFTASAEPMSRASGSMANAGPPAGGFPGGDPGRSHWRGKYWYNGMPSQAPTG